MDPTFGVRLRAQRERQQIPLPTIAETTKIKLSLLEGLERDDISRWPGGVYRRSHVRAYAQAVGLDPEEVVREFLQHHPEPEEDVLSVLAQTARESSKRPPTRFESLISSAIGALPGLARGDERPPATGNATGDRVTPDLVPMAPAPCNLAALAQLCTRFALVRDAADVAPLLTDALGVISAEGLVVWCWSIQTASLVPAFASGYPRTLLSRLPPLRPDADNAIAASFRASETRVVHGDGEQTGALVVPMRTPAGCGGVLALEFRQRREQDESACAMATILAAQLATLVVASIPEAISA